MKPLHGYAQSERRQRVAEQNSKRKSMRQRRRLSSYEPSYRSWNFRPKRSGPGIRQTCGKHGLGRRP